MSKMGQAMIPSPNTQKVSEDSPNADETKASHVSFQYTIFFLLTFAFVYFVFLIMQISVFFSRMLV